MRHNIHLNWIVKQPHTIARNYILASCCYFQYEKCLNTLGVQCGFPCGASICRDAQYPQPLVYSFTSSVIHSFIYSYLSAAQSTELSHEQGENKQSLSMQPHADETQTYCGVWSQFPRDVELF